MQLSYIMTLAAFRILQLRHLLKRASGIAFQRAIKATHDRMNLTPDITRPQRIAKVMKERTRLNHLLKCFEPQRVAKSPAEQIPYVIESKWAEAVIESNHNPLGKRAFPSKNEAATRIGSIVRMWSARKAFLKIKDTELRAIGLLPPLVDPPCIEQANRFRKLRVDRARHLEEERAAEKVGKLRDLENQIRREFEGFRDDTYAKLVEYFDSRKILPTSVEALLTAADPIPPKKSGMSSKQPGAKKTAKDSAPVEKAPEWSTVGELRRLLDSFDWNAEIEMVTESDIKSIRERVELGIMKEMNTKLEEIRKTIMPEGTEPGLADSALTPHQVVEQDIIDLIKGGFLRSNRSRGLEVIYSNLFDDGISSITELLMEEYGYRLSSPVIWSNVKIMNLPRSLLLYGPRGCGKTSLVTSLAHEVDCAVFWIDQELNSDVLDQICSVASHLEPSIILMDSLETLLAPPADPAPKKKPSKNPSDAVLKMIDHIMSKLNDHRVILVACMSVDQTPDKALMEKFNQHVFVDCLCESDRVEFIKQTMYAKEVPSEFIRANYVLLHTLAKLCERLSTADLKQILDFVLTDRRVAAILKNPLKAAELVPVISQFERIKPFVMEDPKPEEKQDAKSTKKKTTTAR